MTIIVSVFLFRSQTHATPQENVIFESIGEMAGATSFLHVQATISLSSITKQFELYKNKLKACFTDPHRVANVMNQQFAKKPQYHRGRIFRWKEAKKYSNQYQHLT